MLRAPHLELAIHANDRTEILQKLTAAQAALTTGDSSSACSALADFTGQVQAKAGKEIPAGQANSLIDTANQIRSTIAC